MRQDNHYVPVLRWKPGERAALAALSDDAKACLTPLLEFPPVLFKPTKSSSTPQSAIPILVADIAAAWGTRPVFCDLSMLRTFPGSAIHPLGLLGDRCGVLGVRMIPVIPFTSDDLSYRQSVAAMAALHGQGYAIRVVAAQLLLPSSVDRFHTLLARYQIEPEQVDLIIDRRLVNNGTISFSEFMSCVPALNNWRSVTLLGGSFPKDLRAFTPGRHEQPRLEWNLWLDDWADLGVDRCPDFGDYTIRYAFFDVPPQNPNPSASIRYASESYWVIMRGEGVLNEGSGGFAQWPANAEILLEQPEFCGADFSEGDRYIAERANNPKPTGTATTWLQATINHHMTLVVNQLAKLPFRTHIARRELAVRRRKAS